MYSATSLLGNIWKLKDFDERQSLMISQRYNLSPLIAKILNISEEMLSIKATTTDNLGVIGKSKGWSVIAITTIYNNDENCSC